MYLIAITEQKAAEVAAKPVKAAFLWGITTGFYTIKCTFAKPMSQAMVLGINVIPKG